MEGQPSVHVPDPLDAESVLAQRALKFGEPGIADGRQRRRLQSVLAAHKPGDRVPVRISRGGTQSTVTVTLGSLTG
jgi:hypothetical protein